MFTGIIETLGTLNDVVSEQDNIHFCIATPFSSSLKIDQSVAHDGVCLTVTQVSDHAHWVTAIRETLDRTALRNWQRGQKINIERCLKLGDRLDGHLVQGHVDETAVCQHIEEQGGSWHYTFQYSTPAQQITVAKGSICINGVSLTVVNSFAEGFSVAIIPYTYEHTNFHRLREGDLVNLEFDVIGKYVQRIMKGYTA